MSEMITSGTLTVSDTLTPESIREVIEADPNASETEVDQDHNATGDPQVHVRAYCLRDPLKTASTLAARGAVGYLTVAPDYAHPTETYAIRLADGQAVESTGLVMQVVFPDGETLDLLR